MASQTPHEIVIVGGNFGGVNLAHYLLQNTLPALKKAHPSFVYHLTLVSPNTHFFFKIASPRAIVNPTQASDEKIFRSLAEAFQQYPRDEFEHVQGKAVGLDVESKTINVQKGEARQDLKYDALIVAVGTASASPLWTLHDNHEKSKAAIKALHASLSSASTVLVAGAGPVGIETAAEIASAHPKVKVTVAASGAQLLPHQKPSIGKKAKTILENMGVAVKLSAALEDATISDTGASSIKLSDGSTETPDVFINATGPRSINTSWLPQLWLDSNKRILTRDAFFRVKGDGTDNVYAIGDVVSGSNNTALEVDAMTLTVASSIGVDVNKSLGGSTASPPSFLGSLNPFASSSPLAQKEYSPMKDTILVTLGPGGGVAQIMGVPAPSFMVKKAKAQNFLLELIEPLISGGKWKGK